MQIDVFTSGIWQTTTTIIEHRGACLVIDPAYFPRELAAIAARVAELGHAEAVVFTHGHWDHVMGHAAFPGVPVWISSVLADSIATGDPRAAKYLASAREFDSRWYVPRPGGHHWPTELHGVADGATLELAGLALRTSQLPGHSPDGLAIVADDALLVGDYLSPCEIPFVEDAPAYRATLAHLLPLVATAREVIPGHGPRLGRDEALAIGRADLAYVDELLAARDLTAALAIPLPRAADVVGMREHHAENCAAVYGGVADV